MEDMVPAVTLPFRIGNSICDSPVEITRVKLFADTASLLADPMDTDVGTEREVVLVVPMDEGGDGNGLEEVRTAPRSDDDDAVSIEAEPVGSPGSVVSDCSSIASLAEDFPELGAETGMPVFMDAVRRMVAPVELIAGPALAESSASVSTVDARESGVAAISLAEPVMLESSSSGSGGRRVFSVDYMPLWGYTSICGRRPEMEDAVTAVTRFFEIPLWMLTGDHVIDGLDPSLIHLPAHFFGVYDGHGGSHVANYCRDRVHVALVERLRNLKEQMAGDCEKDWQKLWERAFIDCFQKVDDEVGGKVSRIIAESSVDLCGENSSRPSTLSDPVAPETVGSTAVVAVICSSHIIVANCGDSRAVLCRGKQPVPLSSDHKPNREDEYARIEAAGGKVIQWNGHRVFGVLAMSRSIGDRYLKPWIIPVPEVTIVPRMREDECLILASDGLWDVMTNEEACDAARRRILLWHKKNGGIAASAHRGEEANPAAQAAADYLSKLALQKGSKDNITVIVVDLKAQRKFKSKS